VRRGLLTALIASAVVAATASTADAGSLLTITQVGRVPFPERAFIIDLPGGVPSKNVRPQVRENGVLIPKTSLTPVGTSDISVDTVLAIDASQSMSGKPLEAAIAAARQFVRRRGSTGRIAIVTFNGSVHVQTPLSSQPSDFQRALSHAPSVAYGTKIYDAVNRSLALLEKSGSSTGSIVVLSDGADVGSRATLSAVTQRARRDHIRLFAVGLKTGAFDPTALRSLSTLTGGTFAKAVSAPQLGEIYDALGSRFASEYLLRYRSQATLGSDVGLSIELPGVGSGSAIYNAANESDPFHRSLVTRFLLSGLSLVLLSFFAAALAGGLLFLILTRPRHGIVERIGAFVAMNMAGNGETAEPEQTKRRNARRPRTSGAAGWYMRLEDDVEIAELEAQPRSLVIGSVVATAVLAVILALVSVPLLLLAFLVPVFVRAWVSRKVKAVRDAFADQLPETLQLLASALRSGHSLIGALNVVVEQAPQPVKREFSQVLTDDQLGVPLEQSLRRIAVRMKSKDMAQVGLIGELQRTVGGNSAEVLDTVVETVRERAEVRRLAQTMTAQGRLARWILSVLPLVLAALLFAMAPKLMKPMLVSGGGQLALVAAGMFVVAGSFWIKKIVEIEV
jgi:tight adherence protein B